MNFGKASIKTNYSIDIESLMPLSKESYEKILKERYDNKCPFCQSHAEVIQHKNMKPEIRCSGKCFDRLAEDVL